MSGADGSETTAVPPRSVRTVVPPRRGATRVILVRHGESACGRAGIVGGLRGCTGLTDRGRDQAAALAARLERTGELAQATALYGSILPRAIQTAAIIGSAIGPGLVARASCDLCELHPGEVDGRRWDEIGRQLPDWDVDPDAPMSPGGESWSVFVSRAAAAVSELARRHRGQTVVVVCHAGVVEATMLRLGRMGDGVKRLGLATEPTSLTEWEHTDLTDRHHAEGVWRLMRFNDAAHLAPDGDTDRRSSP
jgi:broad specificity phosphatase PhoE